jgi:hypothetical protein
MKKFALPLMIAMSLTVAACQERENPLMQMESRDVASWLWQNKTPEMTACASHWADPKTAPRGELKTCKSVAKAIADEMNYQGFAENIHPEDLDIPLVWRDYNVWANQEIRTKEYLRKSEEERKKRLEEGRARNRAKGL